MILKDVSEIWGIPIDEVKRLGKKYRIYSFCIYSVDVLLVILSSVNMFNTGAPFNTYLFAIVCMSLFSVLLLNAIVNPEKCRSYVFYKKFKNCKLETKVLYLGLRNMESILYCSNYRRLKKKNTMLEYKELMLSACREDSVYSKRIGNLLSKFTENNNDDFVEVKATFVVKGKKYYLLSFDDEDK